ncbi:MAG: hypothetical protein WKG00_04135 [Polyangiaceae bacterium]
MQQAWLDHVVLRGLQQEHIGTQRQYYCSSSLTWQPTLPPNYRNVQGCPH